MMRSKCFSADGSRCAQALWIESGVTSFMLVNFVSTGMGWPVVKSIAPRFESDAIPDRVGW